MKQRGNEIEIVARGDRTEALEDIKGVLLTLVARGRHRHCCTHCDHKRAEGIGEKGEGEGRRDVGEGRGRGKRGDGRGERGEWRGERGEGI